MFAKDQYSSLLYRPQEKPKRPQTPVSNSNAYPKSQLNRSYSKNMTHSPHYSNNANMLNGPVSHSRSRVSMSSSASQFEFWNSDQGEIFPEDLKFLLRNEEKNINSFKERIEKEKKRVEKDFDILKTEIEHLLEDLKLSFHAQLDLIYTTFITKYADVKHEVQEIRRLRKEILNVHNSGSNLLPNANNNCSNKDIVSEIEKDDEHFRNFRVYSYLTEMKKQKLAPILNLCTELILIGSADCPFYKSKDMGIKVKSIKSQFATLLSDVFTHIRDYIISPQAIIQKEKQEEENATQVLKQISDENERNFFDVQYPQNRPSPPKRDGHKSSMPEAYPRRDGHRAVLSRVSKTEKVGVVKWAEELSLKKKNRVVTDHQDAILCLYFIEGRYIATGSKDKTINIYSLEGKKLTTLRGHEASICTLSTVHRHNGNCYLASGSDHGCCCLILWDTRSWTISLRIQSHVAAVTCIVDVEDGQHLITGSYDKYINIYNHSRNQILSSNNNKSPVTSLALTSDKRKLISSCLQNDLTVWDIHSTHNGISLEFATTIQNDSITCILEPSLVRPAAFLAGTRNGRIKIYNISGHEINVEKSYVVNQNSIIEFVVLEREMQEESPIVLSCSAKDESLCMTKVDSGISDIVKVNGAFNIQFGCGIGPKIVLDKKDGGTMAILSQSASARQFSLFEMQIK